MMPVRPGHVAEQLVCLPVEQQGQVGDAAFIPGWSNECCKTMVFDHRQRRFGIRRRESLRYVLSSSVSQLQVYAAIALTLFLGLADDDPADLAAVFDVGAGAGLQVEVADFQ